MALRLSLSLKYSSYFLTYLSSLVASLYYLAQAAPLIIENAVPLIKNVFLVDHRSLNS